MKRNAIWDYISTSECYYLENSYDEAINDFIRENIGWIEELCLVKNLDFYYLPAEFEMMGDEMLEYHIPIRHKISTKEISSRVCSALFSGEAVKPQQPVLLFRDKSIDSGLPEGMAIHPILSGDEECLRQQFNQILGARKIEEHCDTGTRFSISMPSSRIMETLSFEKLSKSEIEQLEDEIREKVRQLRLSDVDELIIQSLFDKEERLSRVEITKDFRIMLPDYGMEIPLAPLTKAIYLLFLKHPEGIRFKELVDHEDELYKIYHKITNRFDIIKQKRTVKGVVQPFSNDINIHVTRIKQAFVSRFSEELAAYYIIDGAVGEVKKIEMPREFVEWES